jgi:hypothetical protein
MTRTGRGGGGEGQLDHEGKLMMRAAWILDRIGLDAMRCEMAGKGNKLNYQREKERKKKNGSI